MDAKLTAVLGESPQIAPLAKGFSEACGPVADRRGYLLFCETATNKIMKWGDGAVSVFRDNANGARALTIDHQGRLLTCEKDRITRTEKDGGVTVLATAAAPGGTIYAIDGNVYFSAGAAVYRVKTHGRAIAAAAVATRDCNRPSALALSPNQQRMYVADGRAVRVFDIAPRGDFNPGRLFVQTANGPTGLNTDEAGRIWIASPAGIEVFSPDAKPLGSVALPGPVSGMNWAEGFHDLIATSGDAVYKIRARTNGTRTF